MESMPRRAIRLRPKARTSVEARLAVFTSVDGTLIDPRTFDGDASAALIRRLVAGGVAVIPVSVMTLDEIAPIARKLGLRTAMIIEAGGAIARWGSRGWAVEPCGPPPE